MALPFDPQALRMTRQQLSVAIGVPGETLAYWLKEKLIFAVGAARLGRGNYRRFGYEAVHIAAVLAELSRYGMNSSGLRNVSSVLWQAVEFGRIHPEFTDHDLYCCKNLLAGKEIAERGGEVSDLQNIDQARTRDTSGVDPRHDAVGIPGLRHVEMMSWFDRKTARLLMFYDDLLGENIFSIEQLDWFVSTALDGSVELLVESDPWAEPIEGRHSYICLNIAKIVYRTWMTAPV